MSGLILSATVDVVVVARAPALHPAARFAPSGANCGQRDHGGGQTKKQEKGVGHGVASLADRVL